MVPLFAAATEAFSQANTNCTIAESLERSKPIIELARQHNIRVRGYISVALGCPYEGPDVDPHKVADMTATLLEMGCDEVSVADTTGMGTAPRTKKLLQTLKEAGILNEDIALHFHDTYGQALPNTLIGLEHGVRVFDSSVGGLGGVKERVVSEGQCRTATAYNHIWDIWHQPTGSWSWSYTIRGYPKSLLSLSFCHQISLERTKVNSLSF